MTDDIVTRLRKCDHALTRCHECDYWMFDKGEMCRDCEGRGYFEICAKCGEPMGNARRKWKREQAVNDD